MPLKCPSRRAVILIVVGLAMLAALGFALCSHFDSTINALVALGTLSIAGLAVFGDKIRARMFPPKLSRLKRAKPTYPDEIDPRTGQVIGKAWYFGLKLHNLHRRRKVSNCQVVLTAIHRIGPDGDPVPESMSIPCPFLWAVVPAPPLYRTITSHPVKVHFGKLPPDGPFEAVLAGRTLNFRHTVEANQTAWFSVQVRADNLISDENQIFRVSWDGKWSDQAEEINRHLKIDEVQAEELFSRP